jgi:hypothetical protein
MAETATAVALLFDDVELGGQLRDALRERGARIVHEGALATLTRQLIHTTGAEVLVVNLDEDAADELDRLYDVIDGNQPRVVFNDAAASRALKGWDRARWARHLAVKVMAQGDLDPPRPQNAPVVPVMEESEAVVEPLDMPPLPDFAKQEVDTATAVEHVEVAMPSTHMAEFQSESLAAELEALMAADEPAEEQEFGSGLKFNAEDELPPLHDGHFGVDTFVTQGPAPVEELAQEAVVRAMPSFQLDHLALSPIDESFMPPVPTHDEKAKVSSPMFSGASSWSLVDDDEAPPEVPASTSADFGIEKLSATDYLAPEGGDEAASFIQPGMTLELVSMEEAIAPKSTYEGGNEMLLEGLDSAISRLLVLGAASDSVEAVCTFLSHLPADLRAAVLHVQHLGGKSVESLSDTLSMRSSLPVRVAAPGVRARTGEVLVVPAGQQVRVYRDGGIELQPLNGQDVASSPIDASFTMAANMFGRNAQAIVFAGHANDGLGGCQAIHDRGGQVWVETSGDGHFADMVHGIEAERLNSYSGTPAELAARLVEEMSMEGRR